MELENIMWFDSKAGIGIDMDYLVGNGKIKILSVEKLSKADMGIDD